MIVRFVGTLYDVRVKRDGGGRVQIDFGGDAFGSIVEIQKFFKENAVTVAIALVPIKDSTPDFTGIEENTHEE